MIWVFIAILMIKFINKAEALEMGKNSNYNRFQIKEQSGGIMMLECLKNSGIKKTGIFAAGVLFGTAGVKILSSKDAKKVYTNCTAAVLRARDSVMKTASVIQENAEDIYAQAQQINEDRAAAETEEIIGDESEES